tara:strand:+ start:592 stop:1566 length:975 start_codon:yes stop_codon:yes gene_type:complete
MYSEMKSKIEVALASFNGEKYIKDQLLSIFNQSMKVDQVIICDDKSNDKTLVIIREFIDNGYPIKLYRNEQKLGYSLNFMKCIKLCNADYIFLSDQDDIWHINKVKKMMGFIKKFPDYLCWIHDCSITDSEMNIKINSKLKNIQRYGFMEKSYVMGACMTIKNEALKYIYPFPKNIKDSGHDDWISFVLRSTNNIKINRESLLLYRRHNDITSAAKFNSLSKNNFFINIVLRLKNTFKNNNYKKNKLLIKKKFVIWSKLIKNNYLNSEYQINTSHRVDSQLLAFKMNKFNFFSRIHNIYKLKATGYYDYRSGYLSIFMDLFFNI